jgi:hypothetical protein
MQNVLKRELKARRSDDADADLHVSQRCESGARRVSYKTLEIPKGPLRLFALSRTFDG